MATTMTPLSTRHRLFSIPAITLALMLGANVHAQMASTTNSTGTYTPMVGQLGKDVVWVPTADALVEHMLDMANITPQDYLVDLGSGDGKTVIAAAKRGTRAHGIEYNPDLVKLSQEKAKKAGVTDLASFAEADIFKSDFSDATVVTLFLLPELNLRLRPILLNMKPGTRVVSNSFLMDDWKPDDAIETDLNCKSYCNAYKWVVPAKVAGSWELDNKATLHLKQTFQKLEGHYAINGKRHELYNAGLQGANISFTVNGLQYTGAVNGKQMSGKDSKGNEWSARQ